MVTYSLVMLLSCEGKKQKLSLGLNVHLLISATNYCVMNVNLSSKVQKGIQLHCSPFKNNNIQSLRCFKVILYSYLILKKMDERIIDS